MNNEMNEIKEDNWKKYYKACKNGDIETIKTLIDIFKIGIWHYNNRHTIICAAKNNQLPVLNFFLNEFKNEYDKKSHEDQPKENSELLYQSKQSNFKSYLYGYMIESFRGSMIEVCTNGYLDILKFYIDFLGDIPNVNDFEKCAKLSCKNGHFEMTQYLLNTSKAQDFINEKKYYNSILPTEEIQANDIIKYFLNHDKYAEKINLLKLLETAYYYNNGEIIEYIICDKYMLYSKKVKQKVANWTNQFQQQYHIPDLFENRDKYLLMKKLDVDLPQKNISIRKNKI